MRKQRKQDTESVVELRLWTYAEARKAVPYLRSLMNSLRDAWIDMRQTQEHVRRSEAILGRPNRDTIIRRDDAHRDADQAEAKLGDLIHEMLGLSFYVVDPASGVGVIPFLRGEALSWFVFDLFSEEGLIAWRLPDDSIEMRRPFSELEDSQPAGDSQPTIGLPSPPTDLA